MQFLSEVNDELPEEYSMVSLLLAFHMYVHTS